jgi:cobalt/nickel transport protein
MKKSTVIVLLVLVVVISVFPLVSLGVIGSDAEFGGADGMAEGVIAEIAPDYQPWFASIYEPVPVLSVIISAAAEAEEVRNLHDN